MDIRIITVVSLLAAAPTISADERPAQVSTGLRMGDHAVEGFTDFLVPVAERGDSLFFINPRASLTDAGENEANLGLVWRRLLPGAGAVIGANAWLDSRQSRHGPISGHIETHALTYVTRPPSKNPHPA